MRYFDEIKVNWRALASASVGLASGFTLNLYIANIFAPHLLKEFGWSPSQFAMIGTTIIFAMIGLPVVGRLTDLFGVRKMVTTGVTATPVIFLCYSQMTGSFALFFLINIFQVLIGSTTTSLVYSRLIAERFSQARGLALALAACAAPAVGAVLAPLLSGFIDTNGWRAGYLAVAIGTAAGGAATLLFMPRMATDAALGSGRKRERAASRDYPEIFRNPAFPRIAIGMLLCNLTVMVQSSQLKLILLDRGAESGTATLMISTYAAGIVGGRLLCGFALDRLPTHIVSAFSLGLPSLGLFILGLGVTNTGLLGLSVLLIGLSMGAELDVLAYLVMRYFKVELYSSVYGVIQPVLSISGALGSLLLSFTLNLSGGFNVFLHIAAFATLAGSFFFMALRQCAPAAPGADARHGAHP